MFRFALLTRCASASAALASFVHSPVVEAQAPIERERRPYAVAAGQLESALNAFAQQAGVPLSLDPRDAAGRATAGLRGEFSIDDGLQVLLSGSGLVADWRDGAITIRRAVPLTGRETTLPEVTVRAPTDLLPGEVAKPYAGGQVARGGRTGILGNREFMETPFNQTSYTEQLNRDQQAATVADVLANDPTVRANIGRYADGQQFLVRGFPLFGSDFTVNGLHGVSPGNGSFVEPFERIEVLRGPSAMVSGVPAFGTIGGTVNLTTKQAPEQPLNRLTGLFASGATLGAHVDLARRGGADNQWGLRVNGAYRNGDTPKVVQRERVGLASINADYRGERLRVIADVIRQDRAMNGVTRVVTMAPGIAVPRAPSASGNFQQPWERFDNGYDLGMLRAEYDVLSDLTVTASYAQARQDGFYHSGNLRVTGAGGLATTEPGLYKSRTDSDVLQIGARLRLATGPVRHVVTVDATRTTADIYFGDSVVTVPSFPTNLYHPVRLPAPVTSEQATTRLGSTRELESIAIGDTMSLFDDRLQVVAGVRRQRINVANLDAAGGITSSYDRSGFTPAFGLIARPVRPVALYASYIEGLTQGPTAPGTAVNRGEVFAPTKTRQYEAGVKLDQGSLGASLSVFQIAQPNGFTDPQTNLFRLDGQQRNRGIELLVFGSPARSVKVLGGIALLKGEQTRTLGGINDGKRAIAVPRVTMNLGSEWQLPLATDIAVSGRLIYTAGQFYDAGNTQSIPSWHRFDLGGRYRFDAHGKPVTVRLNVENLFDRDYWASTGRGFLTLGAPRTVLLSVSTDL